MLVDHLQPSSPVLGAVMWMQEWARNQLATAAYKSSRAADLGSAVAGDAATAAQWGCPKCRCDASTGGSAGMLLLAVPQAAVSVYPATTHSCAAALVVLSMVVACSRCLCTFS